jgi:DNA-binding transcriptional LysR family regulator
MDWNSMKIFLAIAEHGNLMAASKGLNLSHSTVFRRLNDLEENAGSYLFDRTEGKYELTELGEELIQLAKPVANTFDDIERHIIGKDMNPQGTVKITTPTGFAYSHLPSYLEQFNQLHPDIKLEVLVSDQEVNMRNRHADIALRVTSAPPEFFVGRQIKEIKWAVYASKKYLNKYGKPDELKDLSPHLFIGAAGLLKNMEAFTWLDKKHEVNIVCRSDDLVTMSHMAETGMGLVILPDDLKTSKIERLFTFKPAKPNKLWILTHPDLRKVERIKIVMKFLTTAFSESKCAI